MKVKEIRVKIDQRIKIIEFESISPDVEMKAELEEGDDPAKCIAELYKLAEHEWAKQALKQIRWIRTRMSDKEQYDNLASHTMEALKKLLST